MANRMIYTRTYSNSSAGRFVSGKAAQGDPLSDTALLEEFPKHADKWNRVPTALVSGSDRIVDSVKHAFDKYHEDGESPADIWIAFIEVPSTIKETTTRVHSARELAERCELLEPNKFTYEVVFEWAVPEKYVIHEVSLQTLIRRGFRERHFLQQTTAEVRKSTAKEFQQSDPWEIGVNLGSFAKAFGARAPLDWVSHQLFYDCVWAKIIGDDVVRLNYAHGCTETVDFQFFYDLDDGIEDSLRDWWLSDIDFFRDYEEFEEWRDMREESITWDLTEFWETWHDVDCDGTVKELSAKEKLAYDDARNKLSVKHEIERAAIEAEAVRIGL